MIIIMQEIVRLCTGCLSFIGNRDKTSFVRPDVNRPVTLTAGFLILILVFIQPREDVLPRGQRQVFKQIEIKSDLCRLVELLLARPNVEVMFGSTVAEFVGEDTLSGVVVENAAHERRTLEVDGVFVAIGLAPENGAFEPLVRLDGGYIDAGEDCLTSAAGIFTAGDCRTKRVRQIATAVADGASAALAACAYLDRE